MRRVNNTQFRRPLIPGQRMAQWLERHACHQMDPGSNPSGGSLGRKLTMGTDERRESYTDDEYNSERALSIDACL